MKRCFKCGETKALAEFYAHPMMKDGHLNKCKTCTKRDVRNHSIARGPEKEREYRNAYIKTPARRNAMNDYNREQRVKWPEKMRARNIIDKMLIAGTLQRQPCEVCGTTERIHAHHPDYFKPLEVRWLCAKHHKAEHMRLAKEEENGIRAEAQ
jgi:hypothetical protein